MTNETAVESTSSDARITEASRTGAASRAGELLRGLLAAMVTGTCS